MPRRWEPETERSSGIQRGVSGSFRELWTCSVSRPDGGRAAVASVEREAAGPPSGRACAFNGVASKTGMPVTPGLHFSRTNVREVGGNHRQRATVSRSDGNSHETAFSTGGGRIQ